MPIGSTDGTGYRYPLNYGTVYGEKDQTAYIMGIHHPVRNFDGRVIAVLRNKKEKKSIWIVAPKSTRFIVNDILEYLGPGAGLSRLPAGMPLREQLRRGHLP